MEVEIDKCLVVLSSNPLLREHLGHGDFSTRFKWFMLVSFDQYKNSFYHMTSPLGVIQRHALKFINH